MQPPRSAVSRSATAILLGIAVGAGGCASYRMGNETLYAPDVRTVYVPIIQSESFRRDLGERLTEAVVKEIELKTPFKVVGTPEADSVLQARITRDHKRVTIENRNDDPRAVEFDLTVEVAWYNPRRAPLRPPSIVPVPPALLDIGQTSMMVAEAGQSVATAQQQAIVRLAEQIVATMEEPW